MTDVNEIDNKLIIHWDEYNEIKKQIDIINIIIIDINNKITEIEKNIVDNNNEYDILELIYIKEHNDSNIINILNNIEEKKNKNISLNNMNIALKIDIFIYNNILNNLNNGISIIQDIIFEINKKKRRINRWENNYNNYNLLFECNLDNILNNM
jgi:hypothetical protein